MALLLTSCVALGKLLNFSVPLEFTYLKPLGKCLARVGVVTAAAVDPARL